MFFSSSIKRKPNKDQLVHFERIRLFQNPHWRFRSDESMFALPQVSHFEVTFRPLRGCGLVRVSICLTGAETFSRMWSSWRACCVRCDLLTYPILVHLVHLNGLSPMWLRRCIYRSVFVQNALGAICANLCESSHRKPGLRACHKVCHNGCTEVQFSCTAAFRDCLVSTIISGRVMERVCHQAAGAVDDLVSYKEYRRLAIQNTSFNDTVGKT